MNVIGSQISFDPLEYPSREIAKQERDAYFRRMKAEGKKVKRFVLKNQLRKYSGFMNPDGRVRDVFYVQVYENN